jgi:hypothetical protein
MAHQRATVQTRARLYFAVLFIGISGPLAGCNGSKTPAETPVAPISNPPAAVSCAPKAVESEDSVVGNVAGSMTIAGPVTPHIGFINTDGGGGTSDNPVGSPAVQ